MNDYTNNGEYNQNGQIRLKTTMFKLTPCDDSDAYTLVKGTITITAVGVEQHQKMQTQEISR